MLRPLTFAAFLLLAFCAAASAGEAPAAPAGPVAAPAPPEPPLAVRGIKLTSDRWVDASSLADFVKSAARVERARDEDEEARAVFKWMQLCVLSGPPAYEADSGNGYIHDGGKILRTFGYSTCDGIGSSMSQLWRSVGRFAHRTYMPSRGHTIAEFEYRDRDGVERWHTFDAHGHWFALTPEGRVAGLEDLVRRPDLVPLPGVWAGYKTAACLHSETFPADQPSPLRELALHPGETVALLWDAGGRAYWRPDTIGAPNRKEFFADGSHYRKTIGAAHFEYRPNFKEQLLADSALTSGASCEGGVPANAAGGTPAVLEFAFPTPYIHTSGSAEAVVRCAADGDRAVVFIRTGRGGWTKLAEHSGKGEKTLKADIGGDEGASIRGRYGFGLKIELASAQPGGAQLAGLSVERWAQVNSRALPHVELGWNNLRLEAREARAPWTTRVTVSWVGRDGLTSESRAAAALPCDFRVFGSRQGAAEPPVEMRSIRFECVRAPAAGVEAAHSAQKALPAAAAPAPPPPPPPAAEGPEGERAAVNKDSVETAVAERILAMERAGGPEVLEKLRKELAAEDANARYWAAFAMGELGDKAAVGDLVKVMGSDAMEIVRISAAESLGRMKAADAVPALVEALRGKTYGPMPEKNRLPFSYLMPLRWSAARALGEIGDARAAEPLIEELKRSNSWDFTTFLAGALARLKAKEAVPALSAKLPTVARGNCGMRACVEALGDLGAGSPEASAALLRALSYRSPDMRYVAILALIKLGEKSALPSIEEAAKADPDPLVQEAARRAREALK